MISIPSQTVETLRERTLDSWERIEDYINENRESSAINLITAIITRPYENLKQYHKQLNDIIFGNVNRLRAEAPSLEFHQAYELDFIIVACLRVFEKYSPQDLTVRPVLNSLIEQLKEFKQSFSRATTFEELILSPQFRKQGLELIFAISVQIDSLRYLSILIDGIQKRYGHLIGITSSQWDQVYEMDRQHFWKATDNNLRDLYIVLSLFIDMMRKDLNANDRKREQDVNKLLFALFNVVKYCLPHNRQANYVRNLPESRSIHEIEDGGDAPELSNEQRETALQAIEAAIPTIEDFPDDVEIDYINEAATFLRNDLAHFFRRERETPDNPDIGLTPSHFSP